MAVVTALVAHRKLISPSQRRVCAFLSPLAAGIHHGPFNRSATLQSGGTGAEFFSFFFRYLIKVNQIIGRLVKLLNFLNRRFEHLPSRFAPMVTEFLAAAGAVPKIT